MKRLVFVLALAGCGYDLNNPLDVCVVADTSSTHHVCGTKCVDNADVQNCGASCSPCDSANGVASCDGLNCSITCNGGFHNCGGHCAANNDPQTCGAACTPCPPVPSGKATCDGTKCGASCNAGYHVCSGECKADSSFSTCGTSCTSCPNIPHATVTCENPSGTGYGCYFACDGAGGYQACGNISCCLTTQSCNPSTGACT
jgi:hypothetical protein